MPDPPETDLDEAVLASAPRRPWLRSAISWGLVLLLAGAFAWALSGKWSEITAELRDQDPWILLGALALALSGVWMSFELWRGVMLALGSSVDRRPGSRLFFVAQLGKYVPGSVWPVVAQMRMGRDIGIPRQRTALAFVLTLGLSVLVGLLVGLAALPTLLSAEGNGILWGLLAVPVLLALLVPSVINSLLNRGLKLLRRPGLETPLSGRDIARGVLFSIAFWIVYGGHVWLLAVGMGADPAEAFPVAIGGFAIAFSIGPLLVVLPAGVGVRETVLVVALAGLLSTSEATAVALTSRGILMLTDGLLALTWLLPTRHGVDAGR